MITIDVSVEAEDWQSEKNLETLVHRAIENTIPETGLRLPEGAEIGVTFTNNQRVRKLNDIWRKKDAPTNVLSFAANEGLPPRQWSPLLGDIVLAFETIAREADEQKKSFDDHLSHLVIHGFLHLLGHDHIRDKDAYTMEAIETRVLAKLGIADPYAPE